MITMMNCRFEGFEAVFGGRKTKQDKGPASCPRRFTGLLPAVRAVWTLQPWGQSRRRKERLRSQRRVFRRKAEESVGSAPQKGNTMSEKTKFALYLSSERKTELERRYPEDGSHSQTEFVDHALAFYLDYLSAKNAGAFLPKAVSAVIEGWLGQFEEHMASLLYKLCVELDIVSTLNAHAYELDDETLRRLRADSVRNVKQTNGRISFEQHARGDEAAWPG